MKTFSLNSILCLLLAAAMSACQYKDLDDGSATARPVTFVYDYSSLDFSPQMMRLVLYPLDGQFAAPMVRDFRDSLTVSIPPGRYSVVAFNDDSEILRYSGYEQLQGNVKITSGLADTTKIAGLRTRAEADYYDYPDPTAAVYDNSIVVAGGIYRDTGQRVTLTPKRVTHYVDMQIEGMQNLQLLTGITVSIDGCYVEYFPTERGCGSAKANVVSHDVNKNSDGKLIYGTFSVFGLNLNEGHTLRMLVEGANFRKVFSCELDGDKLHYADNGWDYVIRLKCDFDIKDLVPVKGAFNVNVDDWNDVNVDIIM